MASVTVRGCFGRVLAIHIQKALWQNARRPGIIVSITSVAIGMFAHYAASCNVSDYEAITQAARRELLRRCIPAHVLDDFVNQQFLVEFEPRLPV